ncbi:porin family protein [uncultured Piscinibacter sp.]|uniref:porin family protein n=1 Tax=uncultured Piscinibacter sp. TaxID=1131835 RepID=UPI0026369F90|nr:porin family protein [uncultured Piscinibacter sp.]
MKKIVHALLCASLLGAAAAHAEGLSVGGSLASSRWKGDDIGGLSTDKSATGGKIYGGYGFTPNFGLEAGYATLGKFESAAGSVKADGFFADAVGTLPLGNGFSALGRVGLFNGKLDSSLAGDDRGTSYKVGAGLQYDFDPRLALRGEWERYRFDALGAKSNTDLYSVGLNYKF